LKLHAPALLQSPKPALHEATPQTPATQFGVPPFAGQARPQALQFRESELVFVSQPFSGLRSQSWKPAAQVGWHVATAGAGFTTHSVSPCWLVQAAPHAAQSLSVPSAVSQPSSGRPLQLAKPGAQDSSQPSPSGHAGVGVGSSRTRKSGKLQERTTANPNIARGEPNGKRDCCWITKRGPSTAETNKLSSLEPRPPPVRPEACSPADFRDAYIGDAVQVR
jgi:hypothetical protein